jgi:DnaJ-class molecular chaperone
MSKIDDRGGPAGPAGEEPSGGPRRRLARIIAEVQDRLWAADEKWAAECGCTSRRSASGWAVDIRDSRFDRRHVCGRCDGEGRHPITGAECPDCSGVGVVTDPERGEQS